MAWFAFGVPLALYMSFFIVQAMRVVIVYNLNWDTDYLATPLRQLDTC